jgi:hypothetical protein
MYVLRHIYSKLAEGKRITKKANSRSSPITGMDRSLGFPEFLDGRYMKLVRLSALSAGHLYPQEISFVLIPVRIWVDTRPIVRPKGVPYTCRKSALFFPFACTITLRWAIWLDHSIFIDFAHFLTHQRALYLNRTSIFSMTDVTLLLKRVSVMWCACAGGSREFLKIRLI